MRISLAMLAVLILACGRPASDAAGSQAMGTIEYVEHEIAATTPARVARVWVNEGDRVRMGDTLVTLTQTGLREEIANRRARLAAAESQVRDLEAGPRPAEVARAEAEVRGASADAERAQREWNRLTALGAGNVSAQQIDAAEGAYRVASARRDAADQALRVLREGTRPDRIATARADANGARAALDASLRAAADLVLTAPVAGVVISRHAESGEVLPAGASLMTIGDVSHPFVRVYVGQSLLPVIHAGDTVTATLDDFADRAFTGRVGSVNTRAEFTPRVALTREERADLLFGVRIEFADTSGMLKAGLPLTVRFADRVAR